MDEVKHIKEGHQIPKGIVGSKQACSSTLATDGGHFRTRYEKWLEHKTNLEEKIKKFEVHKAQYLSRRSLPFGERPWDDEIKKYEFARTVNDRTCRELEAVAAKATKSFDLTSVPKMVDDAMTILKRMAPSNAIFIKPKELRDALALSAPGGVVDEVEVNKDVVMIKERMMEAKMKALKEKQLKERQDNENVGNTAKKGKKKKRGKQQAHQAHQANQVNQVNGMAQDAEGDHNERNDKEGQSAKEGNEETKSHSLPGDDLWYSTLILPQLAQALVDLSMVLEKNLGTEGAVAALNAALMEEALAVDKVCSELECKRLKVVEQAAKQRAEATPRICSLEAYLPATEPIMVDLTTYLIPAADLGDATAAAELARYYHRRHDDRKQAIDILQSVIDRGYADINVYTTLGDIYIASQESGVDWLEAEKCYRIASELQPTKPDEADLVMNAILGRVRIYSRGCHRVPADPVYAAYLLASARRDAKSYEFSDPLLMARMARYGIWTDPSLEAARSWYLRVMGQGSGNNKAAFNEADEFITRYDKWGAAAFLTGEQKTCLQYYLNTAKLHPGIPRVYSEIANLYLNEFRDMKKSKIYIDKAIQSSTKGSDDRVRPLCMSIEYYLRRGNHEKAREDLKEFESMFDSVSYMNRIQINAMAASVYKGSLKDDVMRLKVFDRFIQDGVIEFALYKGQMLIDSPDPRARQGKKAAHQYYLEVEKCVEKEPQRFEDNLDHVYYQLGLQYLPFDESKEDNETPIYDRKKARGYFRKCVELGVADAWTALGMTYFYKGCPWEIEQGDAEQAIKCYKIGIEKGDDLPHGYVALAYFYEHGLGVKQDLKKSHEYMLQANIQQANVRKNSG